MMGINYWKKRFKGCRFTLPRQAIMEVMFQTKEHLTAEEIYMRVHKKYSSCGIATVYRTLELLTAMKIVRRLDFGQRCWRYQFNDLDNKKHHYHLICKGCAKVVDYADFSNEEKSFLAGTKSRLAKKFGFEIQEHEVVFKGLCKDCR